MNIGTLSYDEETRWNTVIQSYGGVLLYNRPEQVLEQYELEVNSVTKGRESYICDTDQGQKLLKEYRGSKERAGIFGCR